MQREDDQELWDLLGKTPAPDVSPFFARNVMREIRARGEPQSFLARWFSPRRLIPATAIAVAILAATIAIQRPASRSVPAENIPETVAQLDAEDYEVVADLDDLLAQEDDNLWDSDSDTSTL
jgi:hypothetical protein